MYSPALPLITQMCQEVSEEALRLYKPPDVQKVVIAQDSLDDLAKKVEAEEITPAEAKLYLRFFVFSHFMALYN